MKIADFELERFFARYEFTTPHLLCSSDVEPCTMRSIVDGFDDECRAMWETLALGYFPSTGHPLLRAAIASLDEGIDAEDVIVFTGAQEAIFATMNTLLSAGDHAIVVWPGYQSLYEVARAVGADVTLVPLEASDGWKLSVDRIRAAVTKKTRLVVINFPHNPTGATIDRESLDALVAICEEAKATLFSDEVYRFLEHDERDRLPAAATLSHCAISLGVLSKSFALAGLRTGWVVVRDAAVRAKIAAYKDYLSICGGAPNEVLAIGALRQRSAVLARSRAIVADNLRHLDAFFDRRKDVVEWVRPRAGSTAFPRFTAARNVAEIATELAERHGVLILPASVYGHSGSHFRVGYGRRNLPEALGKLDAYLAELQR